MHEHGGMNKMREQEGTNEKTGGGANKTYDQRLCGQRNVHNAAAGK